MFVCEHVFSFYYNENAYTKVSETYMCTPTTIVINHYGMLYQTLLMSTAFSEL